MSDATGPISTLPGSIHATPDGTMCDNHPDRPAVARIQGETDSFGCEMIDCCQDCKTAIQASIKSGIQGICDWCKSEADDLKNHRDFEEGRCGRVYQVCNHCIKSESDRLARELDYGNDYYDDGY